MSDYLVVFGQNLNEERRKGAYDFMRHAEGVIACCHVAELVYGVRTDESYPDLFNRVQQFTGTDTMMIIAPLRGAWSGQHVTPAFRCFRPRDDD